MVVRYTFGIAIASLGMISIANAAECSCQCSKVNLTLERPINIVLEPEYHANAKERPPRPKKKAVSECAGTQVHGLQYAPNSEEAPLLKEKETPPVELNGAKYEKTKELYVSPSPDPVKSAEIIYEKTPDPAPSTVQ